MIYSSKKKKKLMTILFLWYTKTVIGYNSLVISLTLKSKLFQVFYMLRRMIIHRILLVCNYNFL